MTSAPPPARPLAAVLVLALAIACGSSLAGEKETDRIAEILGVAPGARVADVGAGDGEWSEDLARRVGPRGHVFATEIDADDLDEIRDRLDKTGLDNHTVVQGEERDTGLPAGCCESILLRLVYHHFTDPAPMRASLHRSLRPGGLLAIVEIAPQTHWRELPGVPERGGHGILPDRLVEEMTADGLFEVVGRHEEWPGDEDHYCVVFRRLDTDPGT